MFDLDASKIVIVGVAALVFIPPKDLPRVLRQVGQFVGKMRRMAAEFQGQFMDAMREADMADLRKEAQKLSDAARIDTGLASGLSGLADLDRPASKTASQDTPMRPLASVGAPEAPPVAASDPHAAHEGAASAHAGEVGTSEAVASEAVASEAVAGEAVAPAGETRHVEPQPTA